MTLTRPLVSIGLPIFNAGEETRRIIECVLAQDYLNFELIISDNASTDNTWEICQTYAQRDTRIHFYRNDSNQGSLANFQRVFDLAAGDYFVWVAHDDFWEPGYVGACVEKLESEPLAVLCYTDQLITNAQTNVVTEIKYDFQGDHPMFGGRVRALLSKRMPPYAIIYGVYRRAAIQAAFPFPASAIPDIHFLLKVAKLGTFVQVHQTLFKRTLIPKSFRQQMKRVFNHRSVLPQSVVYIGFLAQMLRFAITEGQGTAEKLQVAWAVFRYVGYRIVTNAVPPLVRRSIKSTVRPLFE